MAMSDAERQAKKRARDLAAVQALRAEIVVLRQQIEELQKGSVQVVGGKLQSEAPDADELDKLRGERDQLYRENIRLNRENKLLKERIDVMERYGAEPADVPPMPTEVWAALQKITHPNANPSNIPKQQRLVFDWAQQHKDRLRAKPRPQRRQKWPWE
jgi:hypothetical protein